MRAGGSKPLEFRHPRRQDPPEVATGRADLRSVADAEWKETSRERDSVFKLASFADPQSPQVSRSHVINGREFEPFTSPMQNIVAVLGETLHGSSAALRRNSFPVSFPGAALGIIPESCGWQASTV
jgi:hypothetical protein